MEKRNRFGLDSITVEDVNELFEDNNVRAHFTFKRAKIMAALIYIDGINKKDDQGRFFVENSYLCSVANIAEKNLIKALRAFEKNGYITREVGTTERQASKYFINYPKLEEGDKITTYDSEKVSSELDKKVSSENKKVSSELDKKVSSENKKVSSELDKKVSSENKKVSSELDKKVSSENKKVSIDIDKELELDKEKDKEYIFNIINNIIKENNINLINNINYIIKKEIENIKEKEIETMREPNVELMTNLIKSIESINETLQLMNSTMNENFNKLINKIDSFLDSSDKVNDTEDTLGNDTNSSSESESVEEQSNLESESAEDEIKDDSNNESEPIEPETTSNNKPSTIEKEKEKGCAEREKETTEELPNGAIQFTTSVDLEKYIAKNKLSSLENWGKYKIDIDNLVIVPTEMTQEENKSNPEPSNDMDGIVDHKEENKPNLPIQNEPTEDELKFEKRKQKAKELVSRLINEHMTNEQEFNEYFNKGFIWCKKFQLETYYVKLVEKYKPDVDTTEVEEEYALNDIFSNAA